MMKKTRIQEIEDKVVTIKSLTNYSIEFGVLTADGEKKIDAGILNIDQTITKTELTAADAMYFVEYGTLMIPARPVLQHILQWTKDALDTVLNQIYCGVLDNGWTDADIYSRMKFFEAQVNNQIPIIINDIIKK
jgi:argininosuccinate synthase